MQATEKISEKKLRDLFLLTPLRFSIDDFDRIQKNIFCVRILGIYDSNRPKTHYATRIEVLRKSILKFNSPIRQGYSRSPQKAKKPSTNLQLIECQLHVLPGQELTGMNQVFTRGGFVD